MTILQTTQQAEGAILNGSRIVKVNSERGDGHRDGEVGTVIGSVAVTDSMRAGMPAHLRKVSHGYCVKWDSHPHLPVFVADFKIARAN